MTTTVHLARWVIDERHPTDSWPRAAAVLLRQRLEDTMAEHWRAVGRPTMASARTRHQLIALGWYLPKAEGGDRLAAEVRLVWLRLTLACHGGTYELPPTAEQLLTWADVVDRLSAVVGRCGASR